MFKKGVFLLSAVAVLAVTAQAGEIKTHTWPKTTPEYIPQKVCDIKVIMDVGYWIECINQNSKLKLNQDGIHDYSGCMTLKMNSNFNAQLFASIEATGAVPGKYSVTKLDPDVIPSGQTDVELCVKLSNANLADQAGGSKNVHVATVTIKVIPANNGE